MSRSSTRSDEHWDWGSKSFDLTSPPQGSRLSVTPLPDGVRITLRLHDLQDRWVNRYFGLVSIAACILLVLAVRHGLPAVPSRAFYVALFFGTCFILLLWVAINACYRHLVLVVTGDELHVMKVYLGYTRCWRWNRAELYWITAWKGLRFIARKRGLALQLEDNANRLDWLAAFLRATLQLPRQMPALPDEIEVYFTTDRTRPPDRGFLLARQGRFAFRYDFVGMYIYELMQRGHPEGFIFPRCAEGKRVQIVPEDVRCRIDEGDLAELEIQCGLRELGFWLTAYCTDKDALQAALARFRGAREEQPPLD